jgi:hypothetical protein
MSDVANPMCPSCGSPLPPRGTSATYHCGYCNRSFESDARHAPVAHETTADFPRLVADATKLMADVEQAHANDAAEATRIGGTAALLLKAASKKIEERFATTRNAIASRDEPTLRDCVERLTALRDFARPAHAR